MRYFPVFVAGWLLLSLAPAWAQKLECKPCSFSFGDVQLGKSRSYSIELSNAGRKGLNITSKSKRGSAFEFGEFKLPIHLRPGARIMLPVIFKPDAKGNADGAFELESTAENHHLTMDVSGVGEDKSPAHLGISPATLTFGNVEVGSHATRQATLTATNGSVRISEDRSTSSEFVIEGLKLPVTIPAGKSIPVTIRFTPNGSGTDPAKVGFISSAADSPALEEVNGTGVVKESFSVYLSWNQEQKAVGYNVFRGTAKDGPFHEINAALDASPDYTDDTVAAGNTYYYVTTAVNAQGDQSPYSNVTEAVIPNQ
jgi:hypothetical protein